MNELRQIIILIMLIISLLSGYILYIFYYQIYNYANRAINIHETKIFTLPTGTGRERLESLLIDQKIINHANKFQLLMKLTPKLTRFKAGTYRLSPGMTLLTMLEMFSVGNEAQFSLLFVEGSSFKDWKKILHEAPYLKKTIINKSNDKLSQQIGLQTWPSLEGWFYPDTYYYTAKFSDIDILKRAHQKMIIALDYEWQNRASNLPYTKPYEMLIMASIIEKETGIDLERTKVASVFINRMKKKMRLQADPTVIYGLGDKYQGILYRNDLDTPSPYNTYLINGLPPSPIAMPSRASLKAAAHPDESNYYYFVATGNGDHIFTTNYNEHNQAVKHYRQIKNNKIYEKSLHSY